MMDGRYIAHCVACDRNWRAKNHAEIMTIAQVHKEHNHQHFVRVEDIEVKKTWMIV